MTRATRTDTGTAARETTPATLAARLAPFALLLLAGLGTAGCAAVAAGTAGGLIVDEGIVENDGEFDPLENTDAVQETEEALQ